jgi:hypothetical protein
MPWFLYLFLHIGVTINVFNSGSYFERKVFMLPRCLCDECLKWTFRICICDTAELWQWSYFLMYKCLLIYFCMFKFIGLCQLGRTLLYWWTLVFGYYVSGFLLGVNSCKKHIYFYIWGIVYRSQFYKNEGRIWAIRLCTTDTWWKWTGISPLGK